MQDTMTEDQAAKELARLPDWKLSGDGKVIRREFVMKDFRAAVALIGRIAEVAEAADHHPDLHLTDYRKLRVELTTHSAGGLSGKDFAEAAAIDGLPAELKR